MGPDLADNGFYLILGLAAFWLPLLAYLLYLRSRHALLGQEEALLREELGE